MLTQISKSFHDFYYGGNWTGVCYHEVMKDVSREIATHRVEGFHTIAELAYHIHYYVLAATDVLSGLPLTAKDSLSFNCPVIASASDWHTLMAGLESAYKKLMSLIEALPEEKLKDAFADEKYGTYYRNLSGIVEHAHYHLGQMVFLKRLMLQS